MPEEAPAAAFGGRRLFLIFVREALIKSTRAVREIFRPIEVSKTAEYCMYPHGVCRIRKPACAGNGCAIFPVFDTEEWAEKIRSQPKTIDSEVP